jgi:hypothetical protein
LAAAYQLSLAGGVVPIGPVGDDPTTATHGHASVGLRTVMLVESIAQLLLLG